MEFIKWVWEIVCGVYHGYERMYVEFPLGSMGDGMWGLPWVWEMGCGFYMGVGY